MEKIKAIMILLGLIISISGAFGECRFNNLVADCSLEVGGVDLLISARINHCSTPVDVTFHIQNEGTRQSRNIFHPGIHEEGSFGFHGHREPQGSANEISWDYTFVPANQAETRSVSIFGKMGKTGEVLLHMTGNTTVLEKTKRSITGAQKMVDIKAQFIIDGQTDQDLEVVKDRVKIFHFDDCAIHREQMEINLIAVITIVVITLLGIMSLAGLCVYKYRRSSSEEEEDLVSNMQQPSPARPYRLTTSQERGEFHQRMPSIHLDMVHYVVPSKKTDGKEPKKSGKKSGSKEDLKLYISTPNGLKRVVEKSNDNQKIADMPYPDDGHDSVDDEELPPPPLPRKPQIQDPLSNNNTSNGKSFIQHSGSLDNTQTTICSSPSSDVSSLSSDRSLGAIPKKMNGVIKNPMAEKSRRNERYEKKCRQAYNSSSSPISSSSSSGTSVSR